MAIYPFGVRLGDRTLDESMFQCPVRQMHTVLYLMSLLHMLLCPKPLKTTVPKTTISLVFIAREASVTFLVQNGIKGHRSELEIMFLPCCMDFQTSVYQEMSLTPLLQ